MRRIILSVAALLLAGCADNPAQPDAMRSSRALPIEIGVIVRVASGADPAAVALAEGIRTRRLYSHIFKGFAASVSQEQFDKLASNPHLRVSRDQMMSIDAVASWGLDRIDARSGLDNSYSPANDGAGVTIYMIDTGIRFSHLDFEGRASLGWDIDGLSGSDCNGHGTHVAGTAGGKNYGVAKRSSIVAVKVFPGCTGSAPSSDIIAGLDWVAAQTRSPAVVSMSIGGPLDPAMNAAVANLFARGIASSVAAGNAASDACNYSPSSEPLAITVGATSETDARSPFSNWGNCLDVFAPGSAITSSYWTADDAFAVLSGTSMAAPHVAGVAALILHDHPAFTPAQIDSTIHARSTKGAVSDARSINFHLLYSGLSDDLSTPEPPPLPAPPIAPSDLRDSVLAIFDAYSTMRLTWRDNSDNEDGFVVRGAKGLSTFHSIGIGPNTTSINFNMSPGIWTVSVAAYNAGGESVSQSIAMCVPSLSSPCNSAPPDSTAPPPACRMRGKSGQCR